MGSYHQGQEVLQPGTSFSSHISAEQCFRLRRLSLAGTQYLAHTASSSAAHSSDVRLLSWRSVSTQTSSARKPKTNPYGSVCVTGVIRIWYYTVYFKSKDVFWSAAVLYVVSDIECNIGIICGSLPEIRPLLSRWLYKSATAANLTSRSRSRRQGGRPTISAPMASPYVVQRIGSNESRLENMPSTESFTGKYPSSYQRLSKTGGLTPVSPYAIRYDEKGVIHMQEYPIDIHEYPASASPHSSPETLVQSPLQKHHEIQEAELQRPLHSAMSNHRRYSRPDESLMPRPLQSAMSMNRRFSRPKVTDPEMQRPLQSAMSNHQRYSHPETQATSERGSVEMWVGVERPPTRPHGAF